MLTDHQNECRLNSNLESPMQSSMIFGDPSFLSSIIDTSPLPPPPPPLPLFEQPIIYTDDEELSNILDPMPVLTNSAYNTDCSNSILISQQQQQIPAISMTNSSIERLINNLQTPTVSMENSNTHSMLFNSALSSSCAKQHSNSSDDDSLQSKNTNPYVY